jgi:hypothetical protein
MHSWPRRRLAHFDHCIGADASYSSVLAYAAVRRREARLVEIKEETAAVGPAGAGTGRWRIVGRWSKCDDV